MNLEASLTIGLLLAALVAIGAGAGCALSPAWSSLIVGFTVLGIVCAARLRGGRKE